MKNLTGAVAQGDDFFDRKAEIAQFWRDLDTDNLLLLAPRRVGKTSVLRRMAETAGTQGFPPVFIDVSDCANETAFIRRLYTAVLETHFADTLWEGIKESWIGKLVGRVSKAGGAGFSIEFRSETADWARLGEELAGALSKLDGQWLIEVDELPLFVLKLLNAGEPEQRARTRDFLYWLRRVRQEHRYVRWLLAGSIGLDTVTTRLNLADSINDLRIVTLGAFDTGTAGEFLAVLAANYEMELSDQVRRRIIERIGWPAPYYLQLMFHELRDFGPTPEIGDVERAVERLLAPAQRNYFDYWRQRLFDELGRLDAAHAVALLSAVARSAEGVTRGGLSGVLSSTIGDAAGREEKLGYLLDVLQNDGYLVEHQGRWSFRSTLVLEYWRRRVAQ